MQKNYLVLAFYVFTDIEDPYNEVKRFHTFLSTKDVTGRIYINEEGINAQMSIAQADAPTFYDWFLNDQRFKETDIKVHSHTEQAFPKLTVKYRSQLVAMDVDYDFSHTGKHVSSDEWATMIENRDEDTLILDVRNGYEWEVGHFEGTEKPDFKTFREFPRYAKELKKKRNPEKTKVMMYCTGGIRCELYSCLLKEEGFDEVYQLNGGIIKYGLEKGAKHWKGKLFVFDDRLVIPISETEETETVGQCIHCNGAIDTYYNCANMDCNELFISCLECAKKMVGCCSTECVDAPRRRQFVPQDSPKPFRKLSAEDKGSFPSS